MRLIDADELQIKIASLSKLARSDAQKSLMGRVLYIIDQMPTITMPQWIRAEERLPEPPDGRYKCRYADNNGGSCDYDSETDTCRYNRVEIDPVTPSNSRGLDALCQAVVDMYGSKAQISKAIEELSELTTALARWQNFRTDAEGLRAIDNIREEREDVEIMLQQLDAIFGRSDEWQRKKYEHLRQIVGDEA